MDSFFVPDGDADAFRATELTRGPWHPGLQHGGPPIALLGRAIERVPTDVPMQVARVTVDLLRPVPIGRVVVATELVRAGKSAQVVQATLMTGDKLALRATALRVRTTALELDGVCRRRAPRPPLPDGTPNEGVLHDDGSDGSARSAGAPFTDPHAPALPAPADSEPFTFPFFETTIGYHTAMELRRARGEWGQGALAMWMRMRVPLLAGEAPSPLQRVLVAADSGNGISLALDTQRWTFVNPDLTVHLHRLPDGEWVGLDATTVAWPSGVGLAESALHDPRGPIGRSLQNLVVERRARAAADSLSEEPRRP